MTDKVAALRRTALFGELEDTELRALAGRAIEHRLARGTVLFVAGDMARGLYVVVSGALRAYRVGLDGREQVIHVERAGATIAEVPVFDDRPYPSTVAADEDSAVLFIDKRDVRRLCLEHPRIALAALKLLATRLRRCSDLVEDLALREVGQRLARLLLAESAGAGAGKAFQLNLSNQQIATRVGSVREVVSRAFARLQQAGLISVSGREVVILDEAGLKAFGGE